jgi:hypothetical protein
VDLALSAQRAISVKTRYTTKSDSSIIFEENAHCVAQQINQPKLELGKNCNSQANKQQ